MDQFWTVRLRHDCTAQDLEQLRAALLLERSRGWILEEVEPLPGPTLVVAGGRQPEAGLLLRLRPTATPLDFGRLHEYLELATAVESVVADSGETITARAVRTRGEWLQSDDVFALSQCPLLRRVSGRKLRLLGCAFCRHSWDLLADEACRQAVRVAEHFADGRVGARRLERAGLAALEAIHAETFTDRERPPGWAAAAVCMRLNGELEAAVTLVCATEGQAAKLSLRRAHAMLLRDVVGNPYRPSLASSRTWLPLRNRLTVQLARDIYAGRAFADMPRLGDLLQGSGCTEEAILDHCRAPRPHARGCWVLDGLLGVGDSTA